MEGWEKKLIFFFQRTSETRGKRGAFRLGGCKGRNIEDASFVQARCVVYRAVPGRWVSSTVGEVRLPLGKRNDLGRTGGEGNNLTGSRGSKPSASPTLS